MVFIRHYPAVPKEKEAEIRVYSQEWRIGSIRYDRPLDISNQMNKRVGVKGKQIGAFEAKTRLSELLEQVRHGAAFVITKRGHPVAELRPVKLPERRPRFGCDKGRVRIGEDFEAPIPEMKAYTL